MSVPYGAVLFSRFARENKSEISTIAEQTAKPLTMLVSCADKGETPDELLVMSLLPSKGQVAYAAIPGETVMPSDEESVTLAALWRDRGGREAADALSSLVGAPIDRYLAIPKNSLIKLIDQAGTIDFSVAGLKRSNEPMRRILDGDAMLSLVYRSPEEEKSRLVAELAGEMLSQRSSLLRSSDIEKIYLIAVNAGENDLTAADYETRRDALNDLFSNGCTVAHVVVNGAYNDEKDAFTLSNSSISALGLALSR
ncbi:MAG: hypothetical protein IKL92_05510 [Oscillospiraceae bacterium]|nr:hypothetical protein [Oscillospiraceae bacterium]